jgi:hypothetical protein
LNSSEKVKESRKARSRGPIRGKLLLKNIKWGQEHESNAKDSALGDTTRQENTIHNSLM